MELLCIETHPDKLVVAGVIYPLLNKIVAPCFCKINIVNVGIKNPFTWIATRQCYTCSHISKNDGFWWFDESRFIPIGTQDELENYKLSEPALK